MGVRFSFDSGRNRRYNVVSDQTGGDGVYVEDIEEDDVRMPGWSSVPDDGNVFESDVEEDGVDFDYLNRKVDPR